jgi:hypothetical protein
MWHVRKDGECVQVSGMEEKHGRPSDRWETILILILKNLRSYIKKILIWLGDVDFVAEDRDS